MLNIYKEKSPYEYISYIEGDNYFSWSNITLNNKRIKKGTILIKEKGEKDHGTDNTK